MSEIKKIDSIISNCRDIKSRKPAFAAPVLCIISGIVAVTLSFTAQFSQNISFAFSFLGFAAIVSSMFMIFGQKRQFVYSPTKERLKEYVYYIDPNDRSAVVSAVKEGNLDLLKLMESNNTNMRVVVYSTRSRNYILSQMQAYIPYEYIPVDEAVEIKR